MAKPFPRRLLTLGCKGLLTPDTGLQRPPPEQKSIIFLKRPSNYSAGLARVNSTSGPSATPQKRSIFRPLGWVETFGPLMPAVAIFQKGLALDGWLLKGVQGCHGQVLALASQRVCAVQTLAASPHARAVCADPYRFTARERCVQTRAAKIHVSCKSGMDRSYVAPVSPHVHAVQTLAAQIHAACRRHFSKGSAAGRLASERRARMSWTGPSTCFTARACCAEWHGQVLCSTCFTARARCADPCRPNPRCAGPIV